MVVRRWWVIGFEGGGVVVLVVLMVVGCGALGGGVGVYFEYQ